MNSPAPLRLTDRKRLAILEAAAAEFRAHGFEATSMDKIAANAGVSKRTVYNHFPSKDELFGETLVQLFSSSAAKLDVPYDGKRPLREQLAVLVRHKIAMMADPNFIDLARVAVAEAIVSPERARPIIARIGEREEGVTLWVRAAQADGKLTGKDPAFAAGMLHGQVKAMAFWPQVTMGAPLLTLEQAAALEDAVVSMFLAYFASAKATA
jgi:TetR/AcrR family transcriptional regulator, regulator of autoinduction and epiphytic fitness